MRRANSTCAAVLALAIASLGVAHAAPGVGDDPADQRAARGELAAAEGRHEAAIDAYRQAYELRPDPGFLFAIARSYHALAAGERALFYYRRYLAAAPDGAQAAAARAALRELDGGGTAAESAGADEPGSGEAWPPGAPALPATASAPEGLVTARGGETAPVWRRWWFWAGTGALVLATVALVAVGAGREAAPTPTTTLGNWDLRR